MIKIFRGYGKVDIGVEELFLECPSCESHRFSDVMVTSHYFHFYWIPFAPTSKDATVVCKTCGLTRNLDLDGRTLQNHSADLKARHRHPVMTYIGIGLIALILVGVVVAHFVHAV